MAKKKKTEEVIDLTVVVDRSGSMFAMQKDAEGGLNAFFEKQAGAAPNTRVTLVQFDTEYEFVCRDTPIKELKTYRLMPRGCTALLDACGKAAAEALERFADAGKEISKKVFVVLTDGQENSSREWNREEVRKRFEQLKEQGCEVVFLGANIDSFSEAGSLGINLNNTANYSGDTVAMAMGYTVDNLVGYSVGEKTSMCYTPEQRTSMSGGDVGTAAVTQDSLNRLKRDSGLSWSALERVVGVGNATLKKYAEGKTEKMSETTERRLKNAFPGLFC